MNMGDNGGPSLLLRDPQELRNRLMFDFARRWLPASEIPDGMMEERNGSDEDELAFIQNRKDVISRVLSRNFQKQDDHIVSMLKSVNSAMRSKDKMKLLREQFEKDAKEKMIHDFVARGDRHGMDESVWNMLVSACKKFLADPKKLKLSESTSRQSRLSEGMLAVIRDDGKIIVTTSLAPMGSGDIDIVPMGEGNNLKPLLDLISDPPPCAFIVIPFNKSNPSIDQIPVNVPEQFNYGGKRGEIYFPMGMALDLDALAAAEALFEKMKRNDPAKDRFNFLNSIRKMHRSLARYSCALPAERVKLNKSLNLEYKRFNATPEEIVAVVSGLPPVNDSYGYIWSIIRAILLNRDVDDEGENDNAEGDGE